MGDRSSRGESLLLADRGHLIVVKEKDPAAILEFGPVGDAPVGWHRGGPGVPPTIGDQTLTVLATWWLGKDLMKALPDISDATIGPEGCLYLISDKGSSIARLADALDPAGGKVDAAAIWRIEGESGERRRSGDPRRRNAAGGYRYQVAQGQPAPTGVSAVGLTLEPVAR